MPGVFATKSLSQQKPQLKPHNVFYTCGGQGVNDLSDEIAQGVNYTNKSDALSVHPKPNGQIITDDSSNSLGNS